MIFSSDLCPLCGLNLVPLGTSKTTEAYYCPITDTVEGHGMGRAHHYYMYYQSQWIEEHSEMLIPPLMIYHYKLTNRTVVYHLMSNHRRETIYNGPLKERADYSVWLTFS